MSETRQWPIDFGALSIGDRVTVEVIEKAFGVKRGDRTYSIKQMSLAEMIRKQRPDLEPYVRSSKFEVIIMNDAEASRHQASLFDKNVRGMITTHRRTMGVDSNKLEESARAEHERAVYRQGRIVSSVQTARKQLTVDAHKRSTPTLEDPNKDS